MKVVYRGNFQPDLPAHLNAGVPWSTETHLAGSFEQLGHEIVRVQEDLDSWADTIAACEGADMFLWTSTWGMAHAWDQDEAWAAVKTLNDMLPTAAAHLDLFFGIPRADQVGNEPWFKLAHVFTADGGHPDEFAAAGVNHHWMPPGVYEPECVLGTPRRQYASDIAFVGSWRGGYHPESRHRFELVEFLRRNYRGRVKFWPQREQIRGRNLSDLYASAKVIVGDSCSTPDVRVYHSDRIPETIGRGGFLLHPHVEGVTDGTHYTPGEHMDVWPQGDWDALRALIGRYLNDPTERDRIRLAGFEHVKAFHTYKQRAQAILDTVFA